MVRKPLAARKLCVAMKAMLEYKVQGASVCGSLNVTRQPLCSHAALLWPGNPVWPGRLCVENK
jgi:hypothetical protein